MAGGSVRALTVAINARDRATKIVGNLKADMKNIESKAVVAQLKANDAASKPIKNVAACLEATDKAAMQAFRSQDHLEKGVSRTTRALAKMEGGFGRINKSIQAYSKNMERAQEKTQTLDALLGPMAGAAAMTGGFLGLSVMTATDINRNLVAAMNAARTQQDAALYETFVKEGRAGNVAVRALAARKAAVGTQGIEEISAEDTIEFLDLVVAEAKRAGANEGEIESAIEGFFTGSVDTINDILGGFEISNDTINAEIERMRAENPAKWGAEPTAPGATTDEVMMSIVGLELYTKMLRERRAEAAKTGETETDAATRLNDAMVNLRYNVGQTFIPLIEFLAKAADLAARFTSKFPKTTMVIALGAAIVFLVSTIGLALSVTLPWVIALHGMVAGMTLSSVAAGALSAAMGALNAIMALNPAIAIAMVLMALGAILVTVAKRTGVLSKAWEYLSDLWDNLKEMDVGEIGKKAASLLFKMVFPPAALEALVKNIPAIQTLIERVTSIFSSQLETVDEFKDKALDALENLIPGWLKNIWARLKDVFNVFIQTILKLFSWLIPEGYEEQLEAYTQLQEAAAAGEAGDTAEARRYGILGYDAKDDEYKIAHFMPAQNISPTEAARLTGGKGYATWAEYRAMSAEDQAKMTYGYGGLVKSEDMASLGYDVEGWKIFESLLSKSGHKHADAEDVAELAAVVRKPGISTVIVEGGKGVAKEVLTTSPGVGNAAMLTATMGPAGLGAAVAIEAGKKLPSALSGTGTEDGEQVEETSEPVPEGTEEGEEGALATRSGIGGMATMATAVGMPGLGSVVAVEGLKKLLTFSSGAGTEHDEQVEETSEPVPEGTEEGEETNGEAGSALANFLGIGDDVGLLAEGGGIETTGLVIGHEGEEVSPAEVVHKTTAAERLVNTLNETRFGLADAGWYLPPHRSDGRGGDQIVNINVVVNGAGDKWNKFDLVRLIENQVTRTLGTWKT